MHAAGREVHSVLEHEEPSAVHSHWVQWSESRKNHSPTKYMLPLASQVLSCCPATEKPEAASAPSSSAKTAARNLRSKWRRPLKTMMYLIHLMQMEKLTRIHSGLIGRYLVGRLPKLTTILFHRYCTHKSSASPFHSGPLWLCTLLHRTFTEPGRGWGSNGGKVIAHASPIVHTPVSSKSAPLEMETLGQTFTKAKVVSFVFS